MHWPLFNAIQEYRYSSLAPLYLYLQSAYIIRYGDNECMSFKIFSSVLSLRVSILTSRLVLLQFHIFLPISFTLYIILTRNTIFKYLKIFNYCRIPTSGSFINN